MHTWRGWVTLVLSTPITGVAGWLAWLLLTSRGLNSNNPGSEVYAFIGVLLAGIAALGAFGIVQFARTGSIRELVGANIGALIMFALLVVVVFLQWNPY